MISISAYDINTYVTVGMWTAPLTIHELFYTSLIVMVSILTLDTEKCPGFPQWQYIGNGWLIVRHTVR